MKLQSAYYPCKLQVPEYNKHAPAGGLASMSHHEYHSNQASIPLYMLIPPQHHYNKGMDFVPKQESMCSHAFMAMLKPLPSESRRLAAGTLTLSIMTVQVGCAFQPSFSSALPKLNPAMPCQHQAQHELQQMSCSHKSLYEAECLHLEPYKASHATKSNYRSKLCLGRMRAWAMFTTS